MFFVVIASFSDSKLVLTGQTFFLPKGLTLEGYRQVFADPRIWTGLRNTIAYTVVGTLFSLITTLLGAYALSRKELVGRKFFMVFFTITMFFGGGMIPNYILMKDLKLIDTFWVMILPGLIGVYNMILARTFMQNLPYDLFEAASIDGCSDTYYFFRMVLPLSKACMAVIALYYAVGHWNAYFNAFIYLNDRNRYPLALFLRDILINNQMTGDMDLDPELLERKLGLAEVLKYSLIVVATGPILLVYPFAQRYFVKGVMIGSLKG